MINLRAKEKHTYDRLLRKPGDIYEATEQDAKVLTLLGRAEYVTYEMREKYVSDAPTYQTRAMTAEQPALLVKRRGRPRKK